MNILRNLLLISSAAALAGLLGACSVSDGAPDPTPAGKPAVTWQTDFPKAREQAKEEDKKLLVLFTGSDWCPPCMAMKAGLFDTKEFAEYADQKLVPVMFDFPRRKQLPPQQAEDNRMYAQMMRVGPLPTLMVLSPDGKELRRIGGYLKADPKVYVEWIETGKLPPELAKAFADTSSPQ